MQPVALRRAEGAQHPLFDGGYGFRCASKALGAGSGERESLATALAVAGHQPGGAQSAEQLMHRLAADEGAAGKLGVGQPGPLGEQLQAHVLRHAELVRAQLGVHGGAQRGRGPLERVADSVIQVDLTHVKILT